jgi:aspartate carbamoyltransferase regulatory subunit
MYYIRLDEENPDNLVYYCRHCGFEEKGFSENGSVVSKTWIKKNESSFQHLVNKYTKLDPTLPRTNQLLCPNPDCTTNKDNVKEREIIYIRYDDVNIKYLYLCSSCDTTWKNN